MEAIIDKSFVLPKNFLTFFHTYLFDMVKALCNGIMQGIILHVLQRK